MKGWIVGLSVGNTIVKLVFMSPLNVHTKEVKLDIGPDGESQLYIYAIKHVNSCHRNESGN